MNKNIKRYSTPEIKCIKLDNEIALQLESAPPDGPGETYLQTPNYFNNDPFKSNIT